MRITLCTILTNDSDTERQIISWDTEDHKLYSNKQEEPLLEGTEIGGYQEAFDTVQSLYFNGDGWEPEWADEDIMDIEESVFVNTFAEYPHNADATMREISVELENLQHIACRLVTKDQIHPIETDKIAEKLRERNRRLPPQNGFPFTFRQQCAIVQTEMAREWNEMQSE